MITNTDDKLLFVLYVLFLFYVSPSTVFSYSIGKDETVFESNLFSDESIPPCISCDTSVHHTLKALNRLENMNKTPDENCFHKGIFSLMMTYYDIFDNGELDLGVSIIKPFDNKNNWCRFHVYWKNEIQATFLLNRNKSIKSNNTLWSLHPHEGSSTKFWLVKETSTKDVYSDDGSYHLVFGTQHETKFYYYHNRNYIYQNFPVKEVVRTTENNLTFTMNVDTKDAFSDCVDFNLGQNQFSEKHKRFSDFISCDVNKTMSLEWSCNLKNWNSTGRELTFLLQLPLSNSNLSQISSENLSGSIQCRMVATTAGNDVHSFFFQYGPLTTTPTARFLLISSPSETQQPDSVDSDPVSHSLLTMGQTPIVSVLIGISIISILAALSCGCYHRRRMKSVIEMWTPDEVNKPQLLENQLSILSNFPINPTTPSAPNIEVIEASDNEDDDEVESTLLPSSTSVMGGSLDANFDCEIENVLRVLPFWVKSHMVYPPHSIKTLRILGHGQYGTVYKGTYQHGCAVWNIAIKSIRKVTVGNTGYMDPEVCNDHWDSLSSLLEEAKTMQGVGQYHDHIVNLQGITAIAENSFLTQLSLILEFCSNGDLRTYLISHRDEFQLSLLTSSTNEGDLSNKNSRGISSSNEKKLDLSLLLLWSYQIASGMEFLGKCNIYHGDLAARNVLLTDNLDAKISDFGLSKRLYTDITASLKSQTNMKLPMKWLALEILSLGEASTKSDVWSYGVLWWEMFQLGLEPYAGCNDYRILKSQLSNGTRLQRPSHCPERLFPFIRSCWNENPMERPSFTEIKEKMYQDFMFPKDHVPHYDSSLDTDNKNLAVPSTKYEVMRKNYNLIQRSNQSYLSMSVKSYSSSTITSPRQYSEQCELTNRHRTETEETDLPLFSYEIDNTVAEDGSNQNSPTSKDSISDLSEVFQFSSQKNDSITV